MLGALTRTMLPPAVLRNWMPRYQREAKLAKWVHVSERPAGRRALPTSGSI